MAHLHTVSHPRYVIGLLEIFGQDEGTLLISWSNPVSEAQGLIIGDDFFVCSGFSRNIRTVTPRNYALDLRSSNTTWRRMDDLPAIVSAGITHAAYALVGMKLYMCGG